MLSTDHLFLQPISEFFSKLNLEKIKEDFTSSFYDEVSHTFQAMITDEGVYDYEGFISFNEVYLEKFKYEIENARYQVTAIIANVPKDKLKLTNYIQNTLKSFLSNNSEYLKKIPEIKSEVENFKKFLHREFNIRLSLKTERYKPTSIFGLKNNIPTLKRLFILSIKSEIFDEDEVSEEIFIDVLTNENSKAVLRFSCQTPTMVGYLQLISKFFRRLDKKHIVTSNQFFTKSGTSLTAINYDTAKNRFKKDSKAQKSLELIIQFVEE